MNFLTPVEYTVGKCMRVYTTHINTSIDIKYSVNGKEYKNGGYLIEDCLFSHRKHDFFIVKYSRVFPSKASMLFCYDVDEGFYLSNIGVSFKENPIDFSYKSGLK